MYIVYVSRKMSSEKKKKLLYIINCKGFIIFKGFIFLYGKLGHSMWNHLNFKISHLTLIDFFKILSGEGMHQEMKILKILSVYHMQLRYHEHLKYGPFSLDTKPLFFLSFLNYFYSAIFKMKHLKFGLAIHFS